MVLFFFLFSGTSLPLSYGYYEIKTVSHALTASIAGYSLTCARPPSTHEGASLDIRDEASDDYYVWTHSSEKMYENVSAIWELKPGKTYGTYLIVRPFLLDWHTYVSDFEIYLATYDDKKTSYLSASSKPVDVNSGTNMDKRNEFSNRVSAQGNQEKAVNWKIEMVTSSDGTTEPTYKIITTEAKDGSEVIQKPGWGLCAWGQIVQDENVRRNNTSSYVYVCSDDVWMTEWTLKSISADDANKGPNKHRS